MIAELGPGFANMLTEGVGIGGAHEIGGPLDQFELVEVASEFNLLWSRQYSDGVYDHCEWLTEAPVVRRVQMAAGARLARET